MDAMKPSESYTQFDHYLNNPIGGFRLAFQGLVDHFKKDEYETEKERRFHAVESLHKADLSPEEARSLFESAMNLYAKVPNYGFWSEQDMAWTDIPERAFALKAMSELVKNPALNLE